MPILPKQQDIYPDDLLDVVEGAAGREPPVAGGRWVAFYTLSRREKDLMRKLQAAGVPFYGPMVRRRLHSAGGRVRSSYVPLFPGYVFSHVDDEQRRAALATNTVARWIPIVDERMLVDDLRAIKRLIDTEKPLTPEARTRPVGPRPNGRPPRARGHGGQAARGGAARGRRAVSEPGGVDRARRRGFGAALTLSRRKHS